MMLLYGFTNNSAESLIPLARSWNNPPGIRELRGAEFTGYDKGERAYQMKGNGDQITFKLTGSQDSPVHNPCFVIDGCDHLVDVSVDGEPLFSEKLVRQGLIRGKDGYQDLVLWVMKESAEPVSILITKK